MSTINETSSKCPYCGGQLKNFSYGTKKCTCCNHIFNVEFKNPNLLDKANKLRKQNAFQEALTIYKEILDEDPYFQEANWGALLCEYGVEYVLENGQELPTLHRPVQNFKITDSIYANRLLQKTYSDDRDYYLNKITELEEVRAKIESKLNSCEKYDVFISCKISADSQTNQKTPEYHWGKNIYQMLTAQGLKVFFPPYSLPATNGDYEPIIYSALQSASYIVVLASSGENLNSKWVKNEWGRFLELRKLYPDQSRYYKLVITDNCPQYVPAELKTVQYIQYDDNKQWLEYLLNAVVAVFPEYSQCKYTKRTPLIDTIDLDSISIEKNQTIVPIDTIKLDDTYRNTFSNPYKIKYHEADAVYDMDENVQKCKQLLDVLIANKKFTDAEYQLGRYVNSQRNKTDYDYNILLYIILVKSKTSSLKEFLQSKVDEFEDIELIKKFLQKLPAQEEQNMLVPFCDYIRQSVVDAKQNNAFVLYQSIANINLKAVQQLHNDVAKQSISFTNNPELMMAYINIALPYLANDAKDYLNFTHGLCRKLCELSLFEQASLILNEIVKSTQNKQGTLLLQLRIKYKANNYETLINALQQTNNYYQMIEIVKDSNKFTGNYLLKELQKHIYTLLDSQNYDCASAWADVLCKFEFENRTDFFKSVMEKCKDNPQSHPVFSVAIKTMDESQRAYFIKTCLYFVDVLIQKAYFSIAQDYCELLIKYDTSNIDALNYYIFAQLKSSSLSYENINDIKDFTLIEKMLVATKNYSERDSMINNFVGACTDYVRVNAVNNDSNVFEIFDKLLSYCRELSSNKLIKNKIMEMANTCLSKRLFDKAKWYYVTLVRIDNTYHLAYWGILLSNHMCVNDEELACKRVDLTQEPEYNLALQYACDDLEAIDRYTSVFKKKKHTQNNKKKKNRLIIFAVAVFVLITATVVTILIL